jgi:hypothetical protein
VKVLNGFLSGAVKATRQIAMIVAAMPLKYLFITMNLI